MSRIGKLPVEVPANVTVSLTGNVLSVKGPKGELKKGFSNKVKIEYKENQISVSRFDEHRESRSLHGLGYSHPIILSFPDDISVTTPSPTEILISGYNKELVGKIAAKIRSFRKPEPYKGKGIKYSGEYVRRKAGKTAGK